jgi:hypothetical protein
MCEPGPEGERACVADACRPRTAELQARHRLVDSTGPVLYVCNDNPADEVVVTFFETDPPAAIAERGDEVSCMTLQPTASGSKYVGRNVRDLDDRRIPRFHQGRRFLREPIANVRSLEDEEPMAWLMSHISWFVGLSG